jgi:hypothetical protein
MQQHPLDVVAIFLAQESGVQPGFKQVPAKTNQKQPIRNRCGFNPPQPPEGFT